MSDRRVTWEMNMTVIAPPGMVPDTMGEELLKAEMLLNEKSKLRFHFHPREGMEKKQELEDWEVAEHICRGGVMKEKMLDRWLRMSPSEQLRATYEAGERNALSGKCAPGGFFKEENAGGG